MLKENSIIVKRILLICDAILIAATFFISFGLRNVLREPITLGPYWRLLPVYLAIWIYLLSGSGMYKVLRSAGFLNVIYIILRSAFFGTLILSGVIYFFKLQYVSRYFIGILFVITTVAILADKSIVMELSRSVRRRGYDYRNILLVGSNPRAQSFIELLNEHSEWGLRVIGILESEAERVGRTIKGVKVMGVFNDLLNILHTNVVDEVIFVVPRSWLGRIEELLYLCDTEGIKVSISLDFFNLKFSKAYQSNLHGLPVLTFESAPHRQLYLFIKRAIDIAVSFIALVILLPFFIIVPILIKLTSRGPVFFAQERSGLNSRRFYVYKFRTMRVGAEQELEALMEKNEMKGPVFKIKDDPRLTPVGKFLRHTSIDELPQLWNVLKGDMSLVGPRPPIPQEVAGYDNWQRRRLSMRPGITCLWQVNGRNKITDFNDWAHLDLQYIDSWSLWLDLRILLKTIPVVLFRIGAK